MTTCNRVQFFTKTLIFVLGIVTCAGKEYEQFGAVRKEFVSVYASATSASKKMGMLLKGTRVRMLQQQNDFVEIVPLGIPDLKRTWVYREDLAAQVDKVPYFEAPIPFKVSNKKHKTIRIEKQKSSKTTYLEVSADADSLFKVNLGVPGDAFPFQNLIGIVDIDGDGSDEFLFELSDDIDYRFLVVSWQNKKFEQTDLSELCLKHNNSLSDADVEQIKISFEVEQRRLVCKIFSPDNPNAPKYSFEFFGKPKKWQIRR